MQDMDNMHYETEEFRKSPMFLVFLAALPFRRTGPLVACFLALFILVPFLFLVFFAPSLFVTDPTMQVLNVWLDARAIVADHSRGSSGLVLEEQEASNLQHVSRI